MARHNEEHESNNYESAEQPESEAQKIQGQKKQAPLLAQEDKTKLRLQEETVMYRHQDDGPTMYPLALGNVIDDAWKGVAASSSAAISTADSVNKNRIIAETRKNAYEAVRKSLDTQGAPGTADSKLVSVVAEAYISTIKPYLASVKTVEEIRGDKIFKAILATSGLGLPPVSWLPELPKGYGFQEQLIPNVPNYALYGGAVVGLIILRSVFKRKSY